jgi:hypothetical protein
MGDDNSTKEKRSFCQKVSSYFIITKERNATFWIHKLMEFIIFCSFMGEIILVPYTLALGPSKILNETRTTETVIDIIYSVNIVRTICKQESSSDKTLWDTFKTYFFPHFIFDVVSTIPNLAMGQSTVWYGLKAIRIMNFSRARETLQIVFETVRSMGCSFLCNKKETTKKYLFFVNYIFMFIVFFHILACIWLHMGLNITGSWIPVSGLEGSKATDTDRYISALYFIVTTLTTVGYGDFKGYTRDEYIFQMILEFLGIGFFSYTMGSINTILLKKTDDKDIIVDKVDDMDIWLLQLDNSRKQQAI